MIAQNRDIVAQCIAPVEQARVKVEVARFARTLGTLINSGVPILQALAIAKDIVGNVVVAASISRIHKEVKEGRGVSAPMRADGVFPSLAIHMIRVGEETGRMEEMLMKVADTTRKIIVVAVAEMARPSRKMPIESSRMARRPKMSESLPKSNVEAAPLRAGRAISPKASLRRAGWSGGAGITCG